MAETVTFELPAGATVAAFFDDCALAGGWTAQVEQEAVAQLTELQMGGKTAAQALTDEGIAFVRVERVERPGADYLVTYIKLVDTSMPQAAFGKLVAAKAFNEYYLKATRAALETKLKLMEEAGTGAKIV